MSGPVVVFCMEGIGHMQPLVPVIEGLAARGEEVVVMTKPDLRPLAEEAGARSIDLFEGRPLDAADASSKPVPSRFVSFAGVFGAEITEQVGRLSPSLIVHDTFSLIGTVVAERLGLPRVSVHASHAMTPSQAMASFRDDPRVDTSPECLAAVETLKTEFGMTSANPFSYVEGVSPDLNLYPEPPQFLGAGERAELEPLAFFGSLTPELRERRPPGDSIASDNGAPRVFASLGTVIWWYYEREAVAALAVLAESCAAAGAELLVSTGGHDLAQGAKRSIERHGGQVADFADQWTALKEADVFVTHGGPNSVHEAIFHRVPMLIYPFFWDQPALAKRCAELGVARMLGDEPRGALDAETTARLVTEAASPDPSTQDALERARSWELQTITGRGEVIERMLKLANKVPAEPHP